MDLELGILPHYSVNRNDYKLLDMIGFAKGATVYKAKYLPDDRTVAVKIVDPHRVEDWKWFKKEVNHASNPQYSKVNVLSVFLHEDHYWVVVNYEKWDSIKSIMSWLYPDGLPEASIAFVLQGLLKALRTLNVYDVPRVFWLELWNVVFDYRPPCGHLVHAHMMDFSNIFVGKNIDVKLALPALSYESVWCKASSNPVPPLPHWAIAPEVITEIKHVAHNCYNEDGWMVGLIALQLAFGRLPFSNREGLDAFITSLEAFVTSFKDRPDFRAPNSRRRSTFRKLCACLGSGFSTNYIPDFRGKKLSLCFWDMVLWCLTRDPSKRPIPFILSAHKFFYPPKNLADTFCREVFDQLPTSYLQLINQTVTEETTWTFEEEVARQPSTSSSSSSSF